MFKGHRRTASLPSGPLTNAEGFIRPTSPVSSTPTRPVYPSISEFTSLLQTASVSDAEECTQSSMLIPPLFYYKLEIISFFLLK